MYCLLNDKKVHSKYLVLGSGAKKKFFSIIYWVLNIIVNLLGNLYYVYNLYI